MENLKEKFKGYNWAAWLILLGGAAVFIYGVKEIVMESYDEWMIPVGAVVFGVILMRYPSLLASLFKRRTGIDNTRNDA